MELPASSKKKRRIPILIALGVCALLLPLAAYLVYFAYDQVVNAPRAAGILRNLEDQFKAITPLPNALVVRYGSMHKTHQGHVGSDYKTTRTWDEIRAHYDMELEKHGWRYVKEAKVTSWGHDYGGKQAFYCKDSFAATLQYAGQEEQEMGWTYSFSLSWGLFDECK